MNTSETAPAALARLLTELDEHRRAGGEERVRHHKEKLPEAEALLRKVPLVHAVNDFGKFMGALQDRALRSRVDLGSLNHAAEEYFGLRGCVYVAAGVLYPDSRFAFVLSPRAEADREVDASPCDSGSLYKSLCPDLPRAPAPDLAALFRACTLPSPQYREYLVHYVASCFGSATDYITRGAAPYSDPRGIICGSFTSRVFEVRFRGQVELESWNLEAIFMPRHAEGRGSLRLRKAIEPYSRRGIQVWHYPGGLDLLQMKVRDWILERACSKHREDA